VVTIQAIDALEPVVVEPFELIRQLRKRPASLQGADFLEIPREDSSSSGALPAWVQLSQFETEVLKRNRKEILDWLGEDVCLIELEGRSVRHSLELLTDFNELLRYVPVDRSIERLRSRVKRINAKFPNLAQNPIHGNYRVSGTLRQIDFPEHHVFFFSSNELGKLESDRADELLRELRFRAGLDGSLLLGIELKQPFDMLLPIYDDPDGNAAATSLGALDRINREFKTNIRVNDFRYQVNYEPARSCIETWLRAVRDTEFSLGAERIAFGKNEGILTNCIRQFDIDDVSNRLRHAGWLMRRAWTDPQKMIALVYAEARAI
jgi:uncharacterized SAM-dependent methyltransferase